MDLPMTEPRQPAELWGLWVVTHECPEGFWWNHAHGQNGGDGTPMAFVSRDDATATVEDEREELDDGESMMVAPLVVGAPAGDASPA